MNYTFKMIRRVAGKNIKSLYLPIVLSCVDALLHMGMFSTMIMTIIELIGGVFTMQRLTLYGVILVLLFLMRAILFSINYTQVQYRGADISAQQRLSLGDHIRSLNLGYFNKNSIGRLMSTLTTDITDFEQVLTHSLASLIKVLFFSALALLFAFMVSWQYGLIATVLILIAFPLMRLSGEMSQKYGGRQRASVSRVISRIVEYINGIRTFKLYNMTGEKFQRLDDSFTSLKKDSVKLELSIMPFSISFSFVTSLILPAALILAPALYQAGVIDTQRMIALLMIGVSLSSMMATLGSLYPELKYLGKAAENILQTRQEAPLPYREEAAQLSFFDVIFSHVDFAYEPDTELIQDLNLHVEKGQHVAIVGPTGAGKTTIVNLLMRFYDVDSGSILLSGHDIANYSRASTRDRFGMVLQDTWLFGGTIAENVAFGKPDATREEIIRACDEAYCDHFIRTLPKGYDTVVGSDTSSISSGQKQLLTIARALLAQRELLILDEATSNVDTRTELLIQKAMDRLMRGRTCFIIAHRLSTIVDADLILVLRDGRIVEQGRHRDLLEKKGFYYEIYKSQYDIA